ncbi:MAG: phosphoglycerate mutase family protein, partial [Actinomycetes bacterium]
MHVSDDHLGSGHGRNVARSEAEYPRRVSRLLLVRHGQSTWNASGHWQGQADPPLTDLGHDQAGQAAL